MIAREHIHKGLHVSVLSNWIDLPAGTLATVETVGSLSDGTFSFTVRWLGLKPGTRRNPGCYEFEFLGRQFETLRSGVGPRRSNCFSSSVGVLAMVGKEQLSEDGETGQSSDEVALL